MMDRTTGAQQEWRKWRDKSAISKSTIQMRQARRTLVEQLESRTHLATTSPDFLLSGNPSPVVATLASALDNLPASTPLGMGLGFHTYYSDEAAFVDVKNALGPWNKFNEPWTSNPELVLTADGYPLQPATAFTYLLNYPDGVYKLRYEGSGTLTVRAGMIANLTNLQKEGNLTTGDLIIDRSKAGYLSISISAVDPQNPIRNLSIRTPGYENRPDQVFTDHFLRRLRPFKIIRFMDWGRTNTNTLTTWADRVTPSHMQTGENGVAHEYMIELANELHADPWINIPDQADDTYIRNLATLIRDQLDPSLTAYIEYSNEVWNLSFPQARRNRTAAINNPLLTATDQYARAQQQVGYKTKIISEIFREQFGTDFSQRVKVVLAGQGVNTFIINQSLNFIRDTYGDPAQYVGALSMACYIHLPDNEDRPGLTLDSLFSILTRYVDEQVAPRVRAHADIADRYGLPLVAYEGTQALMGYNNLLGGSVNQQVKWAAQYDPRMGALLERLFATWTANGGDEFVTNGFVGPYKPDKYWNNLQSIREIGTPKWDALMRTILPDGDSTLDGVVTYEDFVILRNNFGLQQQWWESGDYNADNRVDFADFQLMQPNLVGLSPAQAAEIQQFAQNRGPSGSDGILITPVTPLITSEKGGTATIQVVLKSQPAADVMIPVEVSDPAEGKINRDKLIFTPYNWNVPQTITITGVDDSSYDPDRAYTVLFNFSSSNDPLYDRRNPEDLSLVNLDDDPVDVIVDNLDARASTTGVWTGATITAGGYNTGYFHDGNVDKGGKSVRFAPGVPAGMYEVFLRWTEGANRATNVPVDIIHAGGASTLTVNQQVNGGKWNPLGLFALDGDDDAIVIRTDGTDGYVIADAVRIVAATRPTPALRFLGASTTRLAESGTSAQVTFVLTSPPLAPVTIPLSSSNPSEGTLSTQSLVFTPANWNIPQTVTVTGVDDLIDDGDQEFFIRIGPAASTDPGYAGLLAEDLYFANIDDDSAGLAIVPLTPLRTTESGGSASFTVALTSRPTADVLVPLITLPTEGQLSVSSLTFTPENWNIPQTVTVTGIDDLIDDDDIPYDIILDQPISDDPAYAALDPIEMPFVNFDNDTAAILVSPVFALKTSEAGGTASFTVVLATQPVANVIFRVYSNNTAEGRIGINLITFTPENWNTPQTVLVTGVDDTLYDGNVTYKIVTDPAQSSDPKYHGLNPSDVSITNLNNDFDTIAPKATLVDGTAVKLIRSSSVSPTAGYQFTVAYTDNHEINTATLKNGNLRITGPGGFTQVPAFISYTKSGSTVYATYSFAPPGGNWDPSDNYYYFLYVGSGPVRDKSSNPVAPARLGIFQVAITTATTQAAMSIGLASQSVTRQSTSGGSVDTYSFNVTYAGDSTGIRSSTIGNDDIEVVSSKGQATLARLVAKRQGRTPGSIVATYRIIAPGGTWDPADNGTYTLRLRPKTVYDAAGRPLPDGKIGAFAVKLTSGGLTAPVPIGDDPIVVRPAVTSLGSSATRNLFNVDKGILAN